MIKKFAKRNPKEGWIYDVAGFMYRAYKPNFVYWESIIMIRKALLAVIVVFAYPLGANLQAVLSTMVLSLAAYFQALCRPFRKEFEFLNEMESVSLLVSLLTFVSSLFFDNKRVSDGVRVLLTVLIFTSNVGLFLFFFVRFCIFESTFLKTFLDHEGVDYDSNRGLLHVLDVYIIHKFGTVLNKMSGIVGIGFRRREVD